jgi:hypothetical protein
MQGGKRLPPSRKRQGGQHDPTQTGQTPRIPGKGQAGSTPSPPAPSAAGRPRRPPRRPIRARLRQISRECPSLSERHSRLLHTLPNHRKPTPPVALNGPLTPPSCDRLRLSDYRPPAPDSHRYARFPRPWLLIVAQPAEGGSVHGPTRTDPARAFAASRAYFSPPLAVVIGQIAPV